MVLSLVAFSFLLIAGGLPVSLGSDRTNDLANRFGLLLVASVAVRESWGVIYFVNKLTIMYYRVREQEVKEETG